MRTRIDLGSSGSIDLLEDIPISLNYSIADIREPEKRNASYSKTISVPGSKNNDKIFGHIFEIGIDGTFNPNIKTPATIYSDGCEQIKGHLRLMNIKILEGKKIYECSIIGNLGGIFIDLGDSLLTDLSLSEYDHVYNKTNQQASWSATIGEGYVYPMIDYGVSNGITWDVENFYPAVYLKEYIDKIFDYAGYSYSSAFFDSNFFKRLIIPYNGFGLRLPDSDIAPRLFRANLTVTQTFTPAQMAAATVYSRRLQFTTEVSDPSNAYGAISNIWTVPYTGYYNIFAGFTASVNTGVAVLGVYILKYNGGPTDLIGSYNPIGFGSGSLDASPRPYIAAAENVKLVAGTQIIVWPNTFNQNTVFGTVSVTSGSFSNKVSNVSLADSNNVEMAQAIPEKIKQKDLFLSVIKKFNLYIETDKDFEKKLIIEPRNDFYSSGVTLDWTSKLDTSQELEIVPMGDLNFRKYKYTYTEDKDYYNELYKSYYNDLYGSREIDSQNEFITGVSETKVIFSPTPLIDSNSHDRIISSISKVSSGNIGGLTASNIRLLYYAGLVDTQNPWTYAGQVSGTSSETTYPYAGHLDSTASPTLDINFGVPREVYYYATNYINNNVYNAYHRQFVEEITDKDSKVVRGGFYLTPVDIMELDFRNEFVVAGHYLRLNRITDYDPSKYQTCICEFIKIKNTNAFVGQTLTKTSGAGYDVVFNDAANAGGFPE